MSRHHSSVRPFYYIVAITSITCSSGTDLPNLDGGNGAKPGTASNSMAGAAGNNGSAGIDGSSAGASATAGQSGSAGAVSHYSDKVARSSVLFTQPHDATDANYFLYKADGLFWGHMPNDSIASEETMKTWGAKVESTIDEGHHYFGRIEYDWGWKWMIDFMDDPTPYWVRDLDLNFTPYNASGSYKNHVWNWQSHVGPKFEEWLKYQGDRMLTAPVSHIMIDSQSSAARPTLWNGGDFSEHAISGFRAYLKNKFSVAELKDLGIDNIDQFNYRTFLISKGITLNAYKANSYAIPSKTPLYEEFVYYLRQRLNEVSENVLDYLHAKALGVPVGATTSPVEARGYIFTDKLDYLAGEYPHAVGPLDGVPFSPTPHYKAAEAVGKNLILFPYPGAWQTIRDAGLPRHARGWVAQAYAMGAVFSIPGKLWIGGVDTWDPGAQNYADIYLFVHEHKSLIDSYQELKKVGYLFAMLASSNPGGMDGNSTTLASTQKLITENISFGYLLFGDPGNPIVPTLEQLEQYDVLVKDADYFRMSSEQQKFAESSKAKVVDIADLPAILSELSAKIDVEIGSAGIKNERISAFPRTSDYTDAPYVIHLLNRQFDVAKKDAAAHQAVKLKIGSKLFAKRLNKAVLHTVGAASREIPLELDAQGNATLTIGNFDSAWGIVELSHD